MIVPVNATANSQSSSSWTSRRHRRQWISPPFLKYFFSWLQNFISTSLETLSASAECSPYPKPRKIEVSQDQSLNLFFLRFILTFWVTSSGLVALNSNCMLMFPTCILSTQISLLNSSLAHSSASSTCPPGCLIEIQTYKS